MTAAWQLAALLCGLLLWPLPEAAAAQPVDLELLLAVDASGSIDAEEWRLQLDGYVAAWRSPEVQAAVTAGQYGAVAVAVVQWSGYGIQSVMLEWTRVDGAAAANWVADRLAQASREIFGGGTSLSGIIDAAAPLFAGNPFAGERRVLDVSGDGANRNSPPADEARDRAVDAGITINGLPILGAEPDLDEWYLQNVIGGPGAFIEVAEDFQSFGLAIRRKLIREIALR